MGDGRDRGAYLYVSQFFAAICNKVQDVFCVKPLGIKEIQKDLSAHSSNHKPTYHTSSYLEYVSLEDVVSQFHSLLPIQLALLSGEHEGQESVATPVDMCIVFINQQLPRFYSAYIYFHNLFSPRVTEKV